MNLEDSFVNTLIGYRESIKAITSKHPSSDVCIQIEKASSEIDQFINNYRELMIAQQKFERFSKGLIGSFSPKKEEILGGLCDSKSFNDWTSMVASCVGDASYASNASNTSRSRK